MSRTPVIIDLRPQAKVRETGTARGALVMAGTDVLMFAQTGDLEDLLEGRPLALLCEDGSISRLLAEALRHHGIRDVTALGAMQDWVQKGGAVVAYPAVEMAPSIPAPQPVSAVRFG